MYVSGLGAHILLAEINWNIDGKYSRPPQVAILRWEDATEEQRKKDGWINDRVNNEKYRFRQHTEQEKEQIKIYETAKLKGMYDYLLIHYGFDEAEEFYNIPSWHQRFEKYNVVINNKIEICKYENGQCDLFCHFYQNGICTANLEQEQENWERTAQAGYENCI